MSIKPVAYGLAVFAWLYALLPATATLFYELHHLSGLDIIYWGYSAFKAAGYYLSISPYRWVVCAVIAIFVALVTQYRLRRKQRRLALSRAS